MTRTVALAGSTGSIGTQAIDVALAEPDLYRIVALGAYRSVDALVEQAQRLRPAVVAVADEQAAAAAGLGLGDTVYFRHAKAGEPAEHLNEIAVYSSGRIIDSWATYRGEGKAFL